MIQCTMNPDVLHQYNAMVPYGQTVESCLNDEELYKKLLEEPAVMILGRYGELMSLNLIAAYMTEQIIFGRSSEEILQAMFSKYAHNLQDAEQIAKDYFDLIYQLEEHGYISFIH